MKIKVCKNPVARITYKGRRFVCCLDRKKRPHCRKQPCAKVGKDGTVSARFDQALLGLKRRRKSTRRSRR
jgi:hypothetical protein